MQGRHWVWRNRGKNLNLLMNKIAKNLEKSTRNLLTQGQKKGLNELAEVTLPLKLHLKGLEMRGPNKVTAHLTSSGGILALVLN